MAYPDHYLLSFGGGLRVTEIWNMNIRFRSSNVITADEQQAEAVRIKPLIQAWGADPNALWTNAVTLSYVKFNRIGPDGEYHDTGVTHRVDFAPVAMGTTASVVPNQISLVLSWMTNIQRGIASKGRVFQPIPAIGTVATTGRMATSLCLAAANAAATFLNAVNYVSGGITPYDLEANVVSRGKKLSGGGYGDGASQRITQVRVGDVPDTQRRRRNALPEVYTLSTTLVTDDPFP